MRVGQWQFHSLDYVSTTYGREYYIVLHTRVTS